MYGLNQQHFSYESLLIKEKGKESQLIVTSPNTVMNQYLKHHFATLLCGTNINSVRISFVWPFFQNICSEKCATSSAKSIRDLEAGTYTRFKNYFFNMKDVSWYAIHRR